MGRLRALAATARVANVPSVVSNTAVGLFLGAVILGEGFEWHFGVLLSGVLLYIGGNFLNDWKDFSWDVENRPERALPQGLFRRSTYLILAVLFFLVGLGLLWRYGSSVILLGLLLIFCIVFYTYVHKRTSWGVVPMGMCRALLPVLGFLAMGVSFSPIVMYSSLGLFCYIMGLSLSARWEARKDSMGRMVSLGGILLVGAGLVTAAFPMMVNPQVGWVGLVPFALWLGLALTKYRRPLGSYVSALLAGIPLLDWIILFPLAFVLLGHQELGGDGWMFWMALLLAPVCFITGRMLQLYAPAT